MLLWALYRPLGKRSLFPGWRADVRWRLPTLQSAVNFVAYAGPIAGVLITKVIIYGVHYPQLSPQSEPPLLPC